jgi:hypothetical protein
VRIASVNDRALVRLIPETRHRPPVLRGLVDSDEEAAILAEIEGETSARLIAERDGGPALDRRELAFVRRARDLRLYGQSHINAAFAYTRATGNRFNAGDRGAWYCAWHVLTSLAEVGFHRTRELGYIGRFDDPAVGYPAGQALAADLRREGHRGLVYPSARHPGGRCFVAFDPGIIQNVRPGASWTLVWRGAPEFTVEG